MTPTEQDNELREKLTNMQVEFCKKCGMDNLIPHIIDTDDNAGQAMRDDLIQLITADRKRVALEAKIDELKNIMSHLVTYHGDEPARAVSTAKIRGRIAQLEQLTTNQEGES